MSAPALGPALDRDLFAVDPATSYLDSAFAAPLPRPTVRAMAAATEDVAERGSTAGSDQGTEVEALRAELAGLVDASADRVALVSSTSMAFGQVAAGLRWRARDAVVVVEGDHPSTVLPWRLLGHRGVDVVEVPASRFGGFSLDGLDAVLGGAGGRVRVVALSWVRAESGWRADLAATAEVAHAHGALLCVDAIQGLGARRCTVDGWGVDVLASGAQKWTLGPQGIGVLALSPTALDLVAPIAGGQGVVTTVAPTTESAPAPTARRHEGGGSSPVLVAGWRASLGVLLGAGVEAVARWTDHLTDRLCTGAVDLGAEVLSDQQPAHRSSIVRLGVPGIDDDDAVAALASRGVVASARPGGIRFSPAGWNDEADVDAALTALAELLRA